MTTIFIDTLEQLKKLTEYDYDKVIGVTLTHLKLTEFPKDILKFKNLKILQLQNNFIEEIPLELYQLTNLFRVNLAFNKIKSISNNIKNLVNLDWIYLNNNCLTEIPEEL